MFPGCAVALKVKTIFEVPPLQFLPERKPLPPLLLLLPPGALLAAWPPAPLMGRKPLSCETLSMIKLSPSLEESSMKARLEPTLRTAGQGKSKSACNIHMD